MLKDGKHCSPNTGRQGLKSSSGFSIGCHISGGNQSVESTSQKEPSSVSN
jgi:hypothetical protein